MDQRSRKGALSDGLEVLCKVQALGANKEALLWPSIAACHALRRHPEPSTECGLCLGLFHFSEIDRSLTILLQEHPVGQTAI
jgi:hypothetical protein